MKTIIVIIALLVPTYALALEQIPSTPTAKSERFNSVSADLACLCGCGTTVKSCPHESCSFAIPVRKQLARMIEAELPLKDIFSKLVATRTEAILASPTFKGFNIVAWVLPFIAIILMAWGIMRILKEWTSRKTTSTAQSEKQKTASNPADDAYKEKMRKELEEMDD